MKNQTNLRMVLCCFCGLVFTDQVNAVPTLLTDGRTISSSAFAAQSPSNPEFPGLDFSGSDSDADSPNVAFGAFNSGVSSAVTSISFGPITGSARQNSTVSPTSFSASGEVDLSGAVHFEGFSFASASGGAAGRSLYSIRFQLLDCYSYDFLGRTEGDSGDPFDPTVVATISLMREGAGSIFTVLNNVNSASASGLLSAGTYLLEAEASAQDSGGNPSAFIGFASYSLTLNLTTSECVPDGGSTALMASLGIFALVAVRNRYWQRDS